MAKKKKNRQERRAEAARQAELEQKAKRKEAKAFAAKMDEARERASQKTKIESEAKEKAEPSKIKKAPIKDSKFDEKAAAQKSKEKKAAQKAAAKKNRKPNVFQRIGLFFKEVVVELKKVNWLTTDELVKSTSVVAGIVVAFTLLTWIADTGFGALAALFLGK